MANLSLKALTKSYDGTEVLHGIDLDVADGEFIVFVGPSGCGKSTTLRLIAGLEEVGTGTIEIDGRVVNNLAPKERNIAMVFQNYAIYPHMSVRKNIGFGLRTSKLPAAEKDKRINEVAALLDMTAYLDRKPGQLSGGQRQRVAIGRAMVRDPSVFLFDEPLSNLDAQLRAQMRLEIKKLHQRVGKTIVFVTHDQVEAMTMADRIVIMKDGNIQQVGTPEEVYHHPATTFVAQFIGAPSMNMIPGTEHAARLVTVTGSHLDLPGHALDPGASVTLGIRPQDLRIVEGPALLTGAVSVVEPLGSETLAYVDIGGLEIIASADGRAKIRPGQVVHLAAPPEAMHLFDTVSGAALT